MGRSRSAVVRGIGLCLAEQGVRRTTMIDIAAAAGIAKATLYNHVRTKRDALALYADEQLADLVALLTGEPEQALAAAADAVAAHPVVRHLAGHEPAALAAMLTGTDAVDRRALVLEAAEDLLGPDRAPVAVRWLISLLTDPGTASERADGARLLAAVVSP